MNSYRGDGSGKLSFFKILCYFILIFIPVIGWIILFFWVVGDVKAHNRMVDNANHPIKTKSERISELDQLLKNDEITMDEYISAKTKIISE